MGASFREVSVVNDDHDVAVVALTGSLNVFLSCFFLRFQNCSFGLVISAGIPVDFNPLIHARDVGVRLQLHLADFILVAVEVRGVALLIDLEEENIVLEILKVVCNSEVHRLSECRCVIRHRRGLIEIP